MGVGDARDDLRIEGSLVAGGDFGGDVRFMHRLVGQHRVADDVADGEDVRHVGAHLGIDRDEAAVGDDDARLVGAIFLPFGARPAACRIMSYLTGSGDTPSPSKVT
jgi:hypothetical protein